MGRVGELWGFLVLFGDVGQQLGGVDNVVGLEQDFGGFVDCEVCVEVDVVVLCVYGQLVVYCLVEQFEFFVGK